MLSLVKNLYILILLVFGFSKTGMGQIVLDNTSSPNYQNPYWLAKFVFVEDPSMVYWFGLPNQLPPNTNQVGLFNGVNTNIGIDTGIIMVTGPINDALVGGNANGPLLTTPDPNLALLQQQMGLGNANLNNLTRMEFDFEAFSDSIEFEYVFASKEYTGYTCSNFNDVFGFFLTGPGINGVAGMSTQNVALIPGTTTPVAINTLNSGFPANNSICLAANPNYMTHSVYFNSSPTGTSYNGMSVPLKAVAQVQCGQFYRMKLAIANMSDNILNSAVFLKAGSFKKPTLNIVTQSNMSNITGDTTVVETCGPAYVLFQRDGNINDTLVVKYNVSGTAQPGVDYVPLSDSLIVLPGVTLDSIEVIPINNGLTQPLRSLNIEFVSLNSRCYIYPMPTGGQVTLWISDPPTLSVDINNFGIDSVGCNGDSVLLAINATGGVVGPNFWWADLDTNAQRWFIVQGDTTIKAYAIDFCGMDTVEASIFIRGAQANPPIIQVEDYYICPGEEIQIQAYVSGGIEPLTYNWIDGLPQETRRTVLPKDTSVYIFQVIDACGNVYRDSCTVFVYPDPIARFTARQINFLALEVVTENNSEGHNNTYEWDFGDGTPPVFDFIPTHIYTQPGKYTITLIATNQFECTDTIRRNIDVKRDYLLYIPNAFSPNNDLLNDKFQVVAEGIIGYEISIFNRWGQIVYFSEDINKPWDGNFNGNPAPIGSYRYLIRVFLPREQIEVRQGNVNLIR